MISSSKFLEKFRRITSAGNYIPEIDGLRFVAIFWVVVWLHLPGLMNTHLFNGKLFSGIYIQQVVTEGGHGVSFFFMISGFILALPFIREKLSAGQPVSLKKYYLRRLTRLEPPYLAGLLISFLLLIFYKGDSFSDQLPHFAASSVYVHNIIYNSASSVLGVAWSLEVEVQFYLMAPFLCFVFLIRHRMLRRILLVLLILVTALYAWYSLWKQPAILPHFLCYFFSGMLLADLYSNSHRSWLNNFAGLVAGIIILIGLPFLISLHSVEMFVLKLILMNAAFYLVLFNNGLKKLMSRQMITIIGGMCYSIYLLHVLIMSAVSQGLAKITVWQGALAAILSAVILLAAVLFISAVFYRLVEQPCMRRDWWKRIFRRKTI
ncbi:MAG TPA: acyltransferase [Chitinophagaceae bacterium]|nr:acyltransferase [Chitinophagaceae bacterium]